MSSSAGHMPRAAHSLSHGLTLRRKFYNKGIKTVVTILFVPFLLAMVLVGVFVNGLLLKFSCWVFNRWFAGPAPVPEAIACLLYTSPSPRDGLLSRMPSSA